MASVPTWGTSRSVASPAPSPVPSSSRIVTPSVLPALATPRPSRPYQGAAGPRRKPHGLGSPRRAGRPSYLRDRNLGSIRRVGSIMTAGGAASSDWPGAGAVDGPREGGGEADRRSAASARAVAWCQFCCGCPPDAVDLVGMRSLFVRTFGPAGVVVRRGADRTIDQHGILLVRRCGRVRPRPGEFPRGCQASATQQRRRFTRSVRYLACRGSVPLSTPTAIFYATPCRRGQVRHKRRMRKWRPWL